MGRLLIDVRSLYGITTTVQPTSKVVVSSTHVIPGVFPRIQSLSLGASDTLPSTYEILRVKGISGMSIMLTSTPTIEAGQYDGQTLRIVGQDDSALVTLQDNTNCPGSTLHCQHARNVVLGKNDNITFIWDLTQGIWLACSIAIDTY